MKPVAEAFLFMYILIDEMVEVWDDVDSLNVNFLHFFFGIIWKESLELLLVAKILGEEKLISGQFQQFDVIPEYFELGNTGKYQDLSWLCES